ncbi:MAG: hypothetical protein MUC43_09765 [Pirellula sp.]|jgi:hypothetical protein|nr:hypothetical protein [Pirellula sp.]
MLKHKTAAFAQLVLMVVFCLTPSGAFLHAGDYSSYKTKTFSFKIPEPWYYAIPEGGGKTVATCYLRSKLRITAKGRFVVETGGAAASVEKITEVFASRMIRKESKDKVEKSSVKLGGVDAVLLKSNTKDYNIPCGAIICLHGGKLYMVMLSVAETEELVDRDIMLKSLLETWTWSP